MIEEPDNLLHFNSKSDAIKGNLYVTLKSASNLYVSSEKDVEKDVYFIFH